jgi:hypothetical protein
LPRTLAAAETPDNQTTIPSRVHPMAIEIPVTA